MFGLFSLRSVCVWVGGRGVFAVAAAFPLVCVGFSVWGLFLGSLAAEGGGGEVFLFMRARASGAWRRSR